MRLRHTLTVLLAGALVAGCQADREEFTAQDEAAIRALNDSAVSYIRAGKWSEWASLSAEDGVLMPPNAKAVTGRAAIEAFGRRFPPFERISTFDVRIDGSGDLAYLTSGFVSKVQGAPEDTAKQVVVFRRTNGEWKARVVSFNSDRPIAAAPPANTRTTKSP